MPYKTNATRTSKGQITLPVELRRRWGLKTGDRVDFTLEDDERVVLTRKLRRSILKSREELAPLSLGRTTTQKDIDSAVAQAMEAQELRVRSERRR
jgi:AbrB family looped-hinge helix DNA binding protein